MQTLDSLAKHYKISTNTPWKDLQESVAKAILYGSGGEPVTMRYDDGVKNYSTDAAVRGRASPTWSGAGARPTAPGSSEELGRYQSDAPCETCHGAV